MGRICLVSGSSRGIGKGIASVLIREGYTVYITGRNEECLKQAQADLGMLAHSIKADFCSSDEIKSVLEQICENEGGLDLVVANVGSGKSIPGADVSLQEYRRVFDLNFFPTVDLCHQALNYLREGGHLVCIGSIAGSEALGAPVPYASAKSAVVSFAKQLAPQISGRDLRVNVVSPGNIMFPGSTWDEKMNKNAQNTLNYVQSNVPLRRFGTPEEIGEAVFFLDRCPFTTGENLVVDGGQTRGVL